MKKISLLFLLIITACSNSVEENTILNRSNCSLPCWNGIIAGQTSENELLEILGELPDIDSQSIKVTNESWNIFDNQFYFIFHNNWNFGKNQKIQGEGSITNHIVSDFVICGDTHTTISEIVEQIGEPEYLISGNNFYGGRTVILTNLQVGVSYWYIAELDNLEIRPSTMIQCLKLFDPLLYEKMLEAKFFSNGYYNAEETLKVQYPWDGYGNLDKKYPPRQP